MKRGQYNKKYPNHFDFGKSLRKSFGESSFLRLVRQYKYNAKKRNIDFFLTNDMVRFLTKQPCYYCGIKPKQVMRDKTSFGHYTYNGIDRKNKNKGYIESNCVTCCKICNRAKSDLNIKEWNIYIQRLVKYSKTKGIQ